MADTDTRAELGEILARLVSVKSLSGEEGDVQRVIADWLTAEGIDARIVPAEGGLTNVVAEIEGAAEGPTLWIGGHCDTVSPSADYTFDPFAAEIRGGRLYGVGAMDMKAGLATAMHTVRALHRRRDAWGGKVIFAALADEEAYSRGANGFVATAGPIDGAIMCEPHFARPSIGAIGKVNLKVVVTGVSAHGSLPHKGVSAVTEAARLLVAIDRFERKPHPVYGRATHCVLNVTSGEGRYEIRVPDHCEFMINWHFMPNETAEEAVAAIEGLATGLASKARVRVTIEPPRYDSFELAGDHPFVTAFAASFARVTGAAPDYEFCFGVSDANIFNGAGIPTLLYGPSGANMHAADEWADLDQMVTARAVYMDLADNLLFKTTQRAMS
ncbi:peptidase M20 [Acuticoccus sediminis]|uniref:Peptidase M20 n=2 Tax=Acuticoccus sediminis TaxID=2184697 RepID=A0A8B2NMI6_9HYPH|nr:peptidase M20 [Acuticoccus sediminis]